MSEANKPIRILLVDDERDFLDATTSALQRRGFQVTGAPDAFRALAIIGREEFDAFIVDIRMPGMEGDELFAELDHCRPETPVIVLSGQLTPTLALRLVDGGVYSVLHKPCPMGLLVSQIRQALESRSTREAPSTAG